MIPDDLVAIVDELRDVERRGVGHDRRGLSQQPKVSGEVEGEGVVGWIRWGEPGVGGLTQAQPKVAGRRSRCPDLARRDTNRRHVAAVIGIAYSCIVDIVRCLGACRSLDGLPEIGSRALVDMLHRSDLCRREAGCVLRSGALQWVTVPPDE